MKQINNKAFTLVELLVVVLIIGILAAIAVPQYQKAVLKADLHRGIALVESLYQAQQVYALTHGDFATDIDTLDISLPLNETCEKIQTEKLSKYVCDFGTIGFIDELRDIYFTPKSYITYVHFFKDYSTIFKAGERWCFASPNNTIAQDVCQSIGGEFFDETRVWKRYKLN